MDPPLCVGMLTDKCPGRTATEPGLCLGRVLSLHCLSFLCERISLGREASLVTGGSLLALELWQDDKNKQVWGRKRKAGP